MLKILTRLTPIELATLAFATFILFFIVYWILNRPWFYRKIMGLKPQVPEPDTEDDSTNH